MKLTDRLASMYAYITGDDPAKARDAILRTETGRGAAEGDPTVCCDQDTAILAAVASELPEAVRRKFTPRAIADAARYVFSQRPAAGTVPQRVRITGAPEKKAAAQKLLQKKYARRMEAFRRRQADINKTRRLLKDGHTGEGPEKRKAEGKGHPGH